MKVFKAKQIGWMNSKACVEVSMHIAVRGGGVS